jgi:hypothetical protein
MLMRLIVTFTKFACLLSNHVAVTSTISQLKSKALNFQSVNVKGGLCMPTERSEKLRGESNHLSANKCHSKWRMTVASRCRRNQKRRGERDDISKWQPRPPETTSISFYLETYPETATYSTRH